MWTKICSNTNLKDTLLAAELGADAVGFVFAPSKRQITPEQVAAIVPGLPASLEKMGVFLSHDRDEIVRIVQEIGLTGVQLHGSFDPTLVRTLRERLGADVSITQTVHWQVEGQMNNAKELEAELKHIAQEPAVDRILIDSKTPQHAGGTGITFDWSDARETLLSFPGKLIVAGGLRPDNVAQAIQTLRPWGVDVASGVEAEPGRKDAAKLRSFIEASR